MLCGAFVEIGAKIPKNIAPVKKIYQQNINARTSINKSKNINLNINIKRLKIFLLNILQLCL